MQAGASCFFCSLFLILVYRGKFFHGDVGIVFFHEDVAVCGVALFMIEFLGACLCIEYDAVCAFAPGDVLQGSKNLCAEMFFAIGAVYGESADVPRAMVLEYASCAEWGRTL